MKISRLLLLTAFLTGLLGVTWFLLSGDSAERSCLPGDYDCLSTAFLGSADDDLFKRLELLSGSNVLSPDAAAALCSEFGFRAGKASATPGADLAKLLEPTNSAVPCRSAAVSGLLLSWSDLNSSVGVPSTRGNAPTKDDVGALLASCRASGEPLCAEVIPAGALLVLEPTEAASTCYRLAEDLHENCLLGLTQGVLDRASRSGVTTDPREELLALCAAWPSTYPREDCFSAVAPPLFSTALGSLGFTGEVDTEVLVAAVDFCRRLGEGDLSCQRAAFPLSPLIGQVGAPNSDRRTTYCSVFDTSLRSECLTLSADAVEPVSPG